MAKRNAREAVVEEAPRVLSPTSMPNSFYEKLYAWVFSGTQVIWLYTEGDEDRAERAIKEFASDPHRNGTGDDTFVVHSWDIVNGCTWVSEDKRNDTTDFNLAIKFARQNLGGKNLIIARDLGYILNLPGNVQVRRNLAEICKNYDLQRGDTMCPIIIIASTPSPHPDIKDFVNVVDVPWPGKQQIRTAVVDYVVQSAEAYDGGDAGVTEVMRDKLSESLLGLTIEEGRKILSFAMVHTGVNERMYETISDEKALSIRKVEGLTYIPHRKIGDASELGGFDAYLDFLDDRAFTYTPMAQQLGIERPRGVVLLGPPGTAKTTAAKITAKKLGLDLVIMDIAAMFKSLVGESERQIRAALNSIAAMNRVALMIDELDKVLAGAHKSQSNDGGVSSRILSYLLSWLANRNMADETDNRTFVIVTMNRTAGIPAEMLRPGRFDRVFSTPLPDAPSREAILRIHLNKRQVSSVNIDFDTIVSVTEGFAGSDLEEMVISARSLAFSRAMRVYNEGGTEPTAESIAPTTEDLLTVKKQIIPMSELDKDDIAEIVAFCEKRTTKVSRDPVQQPGRRKVAASRSQVSSN